MLFVLLLLALPVGQILPDVKCAADASQSYALYLPSNYTADRAWPVILGFDPGGRGGNAVERYQAAAEQYGYIIAGSNNSRNGSPETGKAAASMANDVFSRFRIDPKRVYTAGMSGGARVAFSVALSSFKIAGVFASSAGYPDGKSRTTLPFPVFATAGTDDFNHWEMRQLDHDLTSPHYLAIFSGPHVWLSSELAVTAIEWMEIQAMKSGVKARDEMEIDRILAKRQTAANQNQGDKDTFLALQSIASDFKGLRDVSAVAARATQLGKSKAVRDGLKKDTEEDEREIQMLQSIWSAETRLAEPSDRAGALADLRQRLKKLSEQAKQPEDSSQRRLARRTLSGLRAGGHTADQEYLKMIREYR
ncbi:MAG TPA: hypothetical protein VGK48_12595 [Terriglobia bacterium]|jgi:dienelactone hydrolase